MLFEFLLSISVLLFFLSYLLVERMVALRRIRSIPLRVCITGTRGKSSVTRLLAAALSSTGRTVFARTTGSKPMLINPDGREEEIQRAGPASILEGKKVLRLAAKLGVEALIVEMMSIQPECLFVESLHLFQPHVLVITNVRTDHTSQMGSSREDIAACLSSAIQKRSVVFVPEGEVWPVFAQSVQDRQGRLKVVPGSQDSADIGTSGDLPYYEFPENIQLGLAVSRFMGVDKDEALRGMRKVHPDFGSMKFCRLNHDTDHSGLFFVNLFAANDPDSTRRALSLLEQQGFLRGKSIIAVLNLRQDRGDRTLQWKQALQKDLFPEVEKFILVGFHAHALRRQFRSQHGEGMLSMSRASVEEILQQAGESQETVFVGMGNIEGFGRVFVRYWEDKAHAHGL